MVRAQQRAGYAALFACTHEAVKKLARDRRFVGSSRIGMTAVLHSWGGLLQFHPHLHVMVPAGAVAEDGASWMPSRHDLFVHTAPLARIIRAKFRDAMQSAGLLHLIDPAVWHQDWVVDSQAVGAGETAFRYLARYVYRVAISNSRIISYDEDTVRFRHKSKTAGRRWRTVSLDAMEFMRRFLQHVLPTGFMKIRHFGFLNANCRVTLQTVRELVVRCYDALRAVLAPSSPAPLPAPRCPRCGGMLRRLRFVLPVTEMLSG